MKIFERLAAGTLVLILIGGTAIILLALAGVYVSGPHHEFNTAYQMKSAPIEFSRITKIKELPSGAEAVYVSEFTIADDYEYDALFRVPSAELRKWIVTQNPYGKNWNTRGGFKPGQFYIGSVCRTESDADDHESHLSQAEYEMCSMLGSNNAISSQPFVEHPFGPVDSSLPAKEIIYQGQSAVVVFEKQGYLWLHHAHW